MSRNSLIDVNKHQNKLRKIVALNEAGAIIFTDKTSIALNTSISRSEFIEDFKSDIDKTATYLIDSLGIINSIKNGLIQELDILDNSVESFFGSTYKDGVITLSGVEFIPGLQMKKSELIDKIYNNLFGVSKKELNTLSKTLVRYETATSDIEKALLYPSTVMADNLIEKIGLINHNFNEFRSKMDYYELSEFNTSFCRSGIDDVIQNSTYIDTKGVRQLANSHKNKLSIISELSEHLKQCTFKYVQAIEIDADGDPKKVFNVISQIERLKINIKEKFVLKFRKLGNHNAKGLYLGGLNIVAEDVRDSSALLHEIAHCIHIGNQQINNSKFVNYMISKLSSKIDFENIPDKFKIEAARKNNYYNDPKEVIARALEIAALFANETSRIIWSDADLDLIKSRSHYEEFEGLYFNFNSFDNETKGEMLKLWELFYETSYYEVVNTDVDLFLKIDTKFKRVEKSIDEIIKEGIKISLKEKKELYSLVKADTIDLIIKNKPSTLGIQNLALVLFKDIFMWGCMSKKTSVENWVDVIENQFAKIFIKLNSVVKAELSDIEYFEYLSNFQKNVFDNVDNIIGCNGFKNLDFRVKLKNSLVKEINWTEYKNFRDSLVHFGPISLIERDLLLDIEFVKKYYSEYDEYALKLRESNLFSEEICVEIYQYLYDIEKTSFIPSKTLEYMVKKERVEMNSHMINMLERDKDINKIITDLEAKEPDKLKEVTKEYEKRRSTLSFNGTLGDKIEEIKHLQKQEFEELIKNSTIEDFEHTKTGEKLKVMKISERIPNFKAFNEYLINNKIAYYSKYAQGFIIKNIQRVQIASAIAMAIYSPELLETFATGTLF
ncbi:hypothetical protein [Aliarcobacter lanthieri]|uniref:hypothetical protein n=1 Tax=Aliarcobacter lanthieri TaxID=1355374 RepID=UPI00047ABA07|nr:hypothetical protein [Aliarcobacter lanthieri]QKF59224.1 hypothetical protein ALANTH_1115 [Aliarcobacter lanthieri]